MIPEKAEKAEPKLEIVINAEESPESAAWAEKAKAVCQAYYPKLIEELASDGFVPRSSVTIVMKRKYFAPAAASGGTISVSVPHITGNPGDLGMMVHELAHVIQAYPGQKANLGWLTEGIADYLRCAIYEALPLSEFPRPEKERGYRDSYKVAAGFLFWLESGPAPGIVRQVNAALRRGTYRESMFRERTGRTVEMLWTEYLAVFSRPVPLPAVTRTWRHQEGWFEKLPDGNWGEFKKGEKIWTFQEAGRTADHIELLDTGRNLRLRLTAREVQLGSGNGWSPLYRGDWELPKEP
jgi:hypothetical protein